MGMTMRKNDKELMAIAKTLGYKEPALPRESLEDAINFLHKQTSDIDKTKAEKIHYAIQTIINTMAWGIAKQVIKEDTHD